VAEPMRRGGMATICLAMVADSPTLHIMADRRIVATRNPQPGELAAWGRGAFGRLLALAESERLGLVTDAASLQAARGKGPAIIVAAEGADFLEGSLERLDEALHSYRLRHLQLTHYRVNELGDIQTVPPVHNGLTDFGAEVVRACNRLGIVVDVAHGTYELVKQAAAVTGKPLVLSHTSLIAEPRPLTRFVLPDHARAVAATGGVIGVWPPATAFHNQRAFIEGIARMVDTVGIDHVGIGTDMLGLTVPSVFDDYADLPDVAGGLLAQGFNRDEAGKILGGNYARVFAASVG
jgi:membrane dipeptidase